MSAIAGSTYVLRSHHICNLDEHGARMDELEGTFRGHIGLIEEALDRLEGKRTEADRGKKNVSKDGLMVAFIFADEGEERMLRQATKGREEVARIVRQPH